MTKEEAINIVKENLDDMIKNPNIKIDPMLIEATEIVTTQGEFETFARWVASEIFDEMWEYNKDAFAEIACRKLSKLGIVRAKGDEWELVEPQESEG